MVIATSIIEGDGIGDRPKDCREGLRQRPEFAILDQLQQRFGGERFARVGNAPFHEAIAFVRHRAHDVDRRRDGGVALGERSGLMCFIAIDADLTACTRDPGDLDGLRTPGCREGDGATVCCEQIVDRLACIDLTRRRRIRFVIRFVGHPTVEDIAIQPEGGGVASSRSAEGNAVGCFHVGDVACAVSHLIGGTRRTSCGTWLEDDDVFVRCKVRREDRRVPVAIDEGNGADLVCREHRVGEYIARAVVRPADEVVALCHDHADVTHAVAIGKQRCL